MHAFHFLARGRAMQALRYVFRKGHPYIRTTPVRPSLWRRCERAKLRGRRREVAKMRRRSANLQRRKCEGEHQHRKCQHLTQYISISIYINCLSIFVTA